MADKQQNEQDEENIKHHRVAGLVITPVMDRLGYNTTVEMDISIQSQMIDIICVRRERVVSPPLPPIYWEVFGELNEHNLISFKSYSESFNGRALEEFYGHLTNYCKVKNVKREQVNLYVITNHFPRDLLGPLLKTNHVTIVRDNDVYDLEISTLRPVRFIISSRTNNPVLALFSTDMEKVLSAYITLQNESNLVDDISIYWKQILRHIDKEIKNMYTKEDFLRDYPPTEDDPGIFEWLEELSQKKLDQGIEQGIEQGKKTERIEMIIQLLKHRFEAVPDGISETLSRCTLDQLQALLNPAMVTPDLDTFLTHTPQPDAETEGDSAGEGSGLSEADTTGNGAAEG